MSKENIKISKKKKNSKKSLSYKKTMEKIIDGSNYILYNIRAQDGVV